jgi:hypothetical protein
MTYRITFKSNPRMILLVLLMVLAAAFVVFLFAIGSSIAGFISLVVIGYLEFQVGRHLNGQLTSSVVTNDEGVTVQHAGIGIRTFSWEDISRAGYAVPRTKRERPVVFIYNEEDDRLITIPDEFENFRSLMTEVRRRTDFEDIVLAPGETLETRLAPQELDEE